MAAGDLLKLWKLHLIDSGLVEVRKRAAALDPGKRIMSEIKALEEELETTGGEYKRLHAEQTDLELQQKSIDDKIKRADREIYGGKIINPREIENLQREITSLKAKKDEHDFRLLELLDLMPPAKVVADQIQAKIDAKKKELGEHQKKVLLTKSQLEADFKTLNSQRGTALAQVPPALLPRYDAIRQNHDGTAMAQINMKTGTCGACGMKLPVKSIEHAKEDRVVTCEACHRILYYTEGLV